MRQITLHPGARNLNDDCAVIEFGTETLVLTSDMMTQGVHFLPDQDPADIAWKLVSVNMSDLAAKGAEPVGVLLGYMLGTDNTRFLDGLQEALSHYGAPLLGGDTISDESSQTLSMTAVGRATHCPVPSRGGAKVGDNLYVTGPVGGAMLGFETLTNKKTRHKNDTSRYRRPEALLGSGQALAPLVTAMMDISDGLLLDASRLATASGLSLTVDNGSVPIATPEKRRGDALRWGDDYQLLFTAPADTELPVRAHHIGQAIAQSSAPILLDGYALRNTEDLGYQH